MPAIKTKKSDIPAAKERFLQYFVERRGDVEAARQDAGIGRAEFYRWLEEDEVFRARVDQIRLRLAEEIEGEAFRRALGKGSDNIVITLLKGLKRERYAENANQGIVNVVYISGLRGRPRPGVEVVDGGGGEVRAIEAEAGPQG